jgi:succinoglycan biosynthesis protein ExoV
MKLFYFRGDKPNFGDELNPWLWPKFTSILNGIDDDRLFLGIGSILHDNYPPDLKKIVFGPGYGGYAPLPNVNDGSWEVFFVRGPQTAELLKLDASLALTDPAILVRTQPVIDAGTSFEASFMPHFQSIDRGYWKRVCHREKINFIDPTDAVDAVLSQIKASKVLLAEAMHGAIVADALGTPWVPLRPISEDHHMKWTDWTRSVGLPYEPLRLLPSGLKEVAYVLGDKRRYKIEHWFRSNRLNLPLLSLAGASLRAAQRKEALLSSRDLADDLTSKVLGKMEAFNRAYS